MHRLVEKRNLSALLDSADGSLDAKYEYGAFGEPLRVAGTSIADDNPFRFSTKYLDSESGLIYYGFRYYSPSLGRFLNRDPIGELGGQNLYAFVENDPVNGSDYLGMGEIICNNGWCENVFDFLGRDDDEDDDDDDDDGSSGPMVYGTMWGKYRPRITTPDFRAAAEEFGTFAAGSAGVSTSIGKKTKRLGENEPTTNPSILEQNNGTNRADRVIDPSQGGEDGFIATVKDFIFGPPDSDFERRILDAGAGLGDSVTFGVSGKIRELLGTDENIDEDSTSFTVGENLDLLNPKGLVVGIGKKTLKLGAKEGGRTVGEKIRFGKFKVKSETFHRQIKPEILRQSGVDPSKIGRNPDVKVIGDKIFLHGTGRFKGRRIETDLKASDFF